MKKVVVLCYFFLSLATLKAQENEEKPKNTFDKQRIVYGGGIGGFVGRVSALHAAPFIGYRFTDNFIGGARVIYQYYGIGGMSFSNYGYGILGRYFPVSRYFLHAEYRDLYIQNTPRRMQIPSFLIGAGYFERPFTAFVTYDLLWTVRSPYPNPVQMNVGVMF